MDLITKLENWFRSSGLPKPEFSAPPNPEWGDLSTALPLKEAKAQKTAPVKLAESFVQKLETKKPAVVSTVSFSAPGYINLFLDPKESAKLALSTKACHLAPSVKGKIVIEHTSVNPNKAAHVGHIRNAVLGDSVARLLKRTGHKIEVQNYIDDTGVQVADVVFAKEFLKTAPKPGQKFDHWAWEIYAQIQDHLDNPNLKAQRDNILHLIEKRDPKWSKKVLNLAKKIVTLQLETFARLGVQYDALIWESSILEREVLKKTLDTLKRHKVIKLETSGPNAGAWIVPFGGTIKLKNGKEVSKDKVLVKSNGVATYLAKDIAYLLSEAKFAKVKVLLLYREIDHPGIKNQKLLTTEGGDKPKSVGRASQTITPIDARQSYLQEVLRESLEKLGFGDIAKKAKHLSYEVVSLSPETAETLGSTVGAKKTSVAMSGRRGLGIKADDLFEMIEKIAADRGAKGRAKQLLARAAIRYSMLKIAPSTMIVFDLKEATRTNGDSGVYLCYAYVRAKSILRKLSRSLSNRVVVPKTELAKSERDLINKINIWPEILRRAARELDLVSIANFAMELASLFTAFYEDKTLGPIRREKSKNKKRFRLSLTAAFARTLKDNLDILGIEPPERI